MRTTIDLDDDVAAAVERLRQDRSLGKSEAVNELIRTALAIRDEPARFVQRSHSMGRAIDYANVAEAIETLDGPRAR